MLDEGRRGHRSHMELLQCTASPPGGSGQWNSCNALPHCLGAFLPGALHTLGKAILLVGVQSLITAAGGRGGKA